MSSRSPLCRRVRVVVRTRPTANFAGGVIQLEEDGKTVSIHLPKNDDQVQGFVNNRQICWSFKLDRVLHNASQEELYSVCVEDITTRLLDGFNGTVLAYGQTGAGKSHTMTGPPHNSYPLRGAIPRAIAQVFREVRERQESSIVVRMSYLEVYNETLCDLLATLPASSSSDEEDTSAATKSATPNTLTITEDKGGGVSVQGLTVRLASNEQEALNMLFEGETNRTIAEHSLNKHSSRSHCIFTIHVESRSRTHSCPNYTVSKLNLVDLAGSERLSKTNSSGTIEQEAMHINKSLSFLEQVIVALADKRRGHIPYRQSKLTHVLRDSLGGNCQTLMIANIWTEAAQIDETLSTLRFATRVMGVTNEPVQNVLQDPHLLVRQYEHEISALKQELAMHDTLASRGSVSYEPLSESQKEEISREVQQYVEGATPELEIVSVRRLRATFEEFRQLVLGARKEAARPTGEAKEATPTPSLVTRKTKAQQGKFAAPPPSIADGDAHLVGESDGAGFGVGVAPSSQKHPASPMAASKKNRATARRGSDAKHRDSKGSLPPQELLEAAGEKPSSRPSTPPPRPEAFEQFKKGRGSTLNDILLSNKEELRGKRKTAAEVATSINACKRKIDELRSYLDGCRVARESGEGGGLEGERGEVVIEEPEYLALTQLKEAQAQYSEFSAGVRRVQAEVGYCQHLVEQCRARLLTEFEAWYKTAFLGETPPDPDQGGRGEACAEYEHQKFDRLQAALLKDDPATIAFYNAQLRTEKRVYDTPHRRKAGQISSSVTNRPPGVMAFN